jgi:hypothetical protein
MGITSSVLRRTHIKFFHLRRNTFYILALTKLAWDDTQKDKIKTVHMEPRGNDEAGQWTRKWRAANARFVTPQTVQAWKRGGRRSAARDRESGCRRGRPACR